MKIAELLREDALGNTALEMALRAELKVPQHEAEGILAWLRGENTDDNTDVVAFNTLAQHFNERLQQYERVVDPSELVARWMEQLLKTKYDLTL